MFNLANQKDSTILSFLILYIFYNFLLFSNLKLQQILCAIKKPFVARLNWIRPEINKLSQLKYMCAKKKITTEKET
jgi:hypothetical protein